MKHWFSILYRYINVIAAIRKLDFSFTLQIIIASQYFVFGRSSIILALNYFDDFLCFMGRDQ